MRTTSEKLNYVLSLNWKSRIVFNILISLNTHPVYFITFNEISLQYFRNNIQILYFSKYYIYVKNKKMVKCKMRSFKILQNKIKCHVLCFMKEIRMSNYNEWWFVYKKKQKLEDKNGNITGNFHGNCCNLLFTFVKKVWFWVSNLNLSHHDTYSFITTLLLSYLHDGHEEMQNSIE